MVSLAVPKLIRHAVHVIISILYEKSMEYNKNSNGRFHIKNDFH